MSGRRILSDEQLEKMVALREKGWGLQRIADHFTAAGTPISMGSISWQCLRLGADAPPRLRGKLCQPTEAYQRGGRTVRPFSAADDTLLQVLDLQGFRVSVMAKRLGRRENSIRGRLLTLARREARAEDASL